MSFFFASLLLVFTSQLCAQSAEGGAVIFGGPSVENTTLFGDWTLSGGGVGGHYLTDALYIGGGGFGISQTKADYEYGMGYGGLLLGYNWKSAEDRTSLNCHLLGGYGTITREGPDKMEDKDNFWVVKPGVEVEFRITSWWRIGIGGGYRWVSGANLSQVNNADLSAPYSSLTFRFGNFGR